MKFFNVLNALKVRFKTALKTCVMRGVSGPSTRCPGGGGNLEGHLVFGLGRIKMVLAKYIPILPVLRLATRAYFFYARSNLFPLAGTNWKSI